MQVSLMAEIKDFNSLFRLDGKVAVVTGGRSISVFASLLVMSLEFLSTSLLKGPLQSQDLEHFLGLIQVASFRRRAPMDVASASAHAPCVSRHRVATRLVTH